MSDRAFWVIAIRNWRTSWNSDLGPLKHRFYAYLDMLFIDHGFLRCLFANRYRVNSKMWRQNHPLPWSVARMARRGVKTIINLRGDPGNGAYVLSKEACERHGVKMVDFKAHSRQLPRKEMLFAAKELFDQIEYPALLHCKSGADRAGLMSALYLMLHEGVPVEQAKKQLSWRYGHIRQAKTGILDYFLDAYEAANQREPIDFLEWVEKEYDPEALNRSFKSSGWANTLVDKLLNRE